MSTTDHARRLTRRQAGTSDGRAPPSGVAARVVTGETARTPCQRLRNGRRPSWRTLRHGRVLGHGRWLRSMAFNYQRRTERRCASWRGFTRNRWL